MKNTTLILGTIAMLISCTEIENLFPVSSLTLDETELLIEEGETYTLSVTVSPSDADQAVHWKSDDESIATVGDEGKITAVSLGTTIIKAVAGDVSASCEVTVNRSVPQEGDYFDEYGINHFSKRFFFSLDLSAATVSARSEGASVRCVQDKAKH